jgi:chemotaxis protein MotB
MVLTSDGLRMIIFDREDTPIFLDGSRELTEWGDFLMQNLAWLLSRYSFNVVIEGHSGSPSAEETAGDPEYGPWELSTGRANMVRRLLEKYAGGGVGISRVTGYGDKRPLEDGEGNGRTHQRITLSLTLPNPTGYQSGAPAQAPEDG